MSEFSEDVSTAGGVVVPASAMKWRFSRSGGPGGQGVNTTDSQVELVVDLTQFAQEVQSALVLRLGDEIVVRSSVERSQLANRRDALERMLERIDDALVVKPSRRATRVPRARREERLREKRTRANRLQNRREDL